MKTEFAIQTRCFPVVIRDNRTGDTMEDMIVLDKGRLQAAQAVGLDSEELIYRIYNREGYRVLEIGKPTRRTIDLDLQELYRLHNMAKLAGGESA